MEKTELKSLLGAIVDSLPDNKKSQEDKTPKNYCESFTPFSWTPNVEPPCPEINFIGRVHDIFTGIELVLELIEDSQLCRDDENNAPFLHEGQQSKLLRLAISASALLSERSMEILSWKENAARKKAKS